MPIGISVGIADHRRLDELIGFAPLVGGGDGVLTAHRAFAFAQHHGVVGTLSPIPTAVTVHGKIPAADGCYAADPEFPHGRLEISEVLPSARRRNVASVSECMYENFFAACVLGHAEKADEMIDVAVYSTVGNQAHQMQAASGSRSAFNGRPQSFVVEERAAFDFVLDAQCVLVNHTARRRCSSGRHWNPPFGRA